MVAVVGDGVNGCSGRRRGRMVVVVGDGLDNVAGDKTATAASL